MNLSSSTNPTPDSESMHKLELDLEHADHTHSVQFYSDDSFLLEGLSRFIGSALGAGDAGVVIATPAHRQELARRLALRGLDLPAMEERGRYVAQDAAETLSRFMVNGWPDEALFLDEVGELISRAKAAARPEHGRAALFGEMVALLWSEGKSDSALRLEQLWNQIAHSHSFSLVCAYPLSGFYQQDHGDLFYKICAEHARVLPAESYTLAAEDERSRLVAGWQQKALALENEMSVSRRLHVAAAKLAAIVDSSDDAIVSKDLNGIVASWNSSAERMFGFKAEEIIGKSIRLIIPPELQQDEDVILSRIRRGRPIRHMDTVRMRKDGSRIHVSLSISPVRNECGEIIGVSKIARDITERKLTEQALRESEERYRLLAHTAPDAIFCMNEHGKVTFANLAAEELFGYSAGEMLGQPLSGLIPQVPGELCRDGAPEACRSGIQLEGVRKNGALLPLELSLGVSSIDSNHLITAVVRDLSERKRTEEALRMTEKLAATGQLASSIAHEINNPMQALTNLLVLLSKQTAADEESHRLVRMAETELQRMAKISRQMLSFYRKDDKAQSVKVGEMALEVQELLARMLEAKGIMLDKRLDMEAQVEAFPGELRQLLTNLMCNAVEACSSQGRIRIRIARCSRNGERETAGVRIVIADNGAGIAPGVMPHIFEPFFTTKGEKGTGLGLWVAKGILAKHDGTLQVRSGTIRGNSGTVFSVFIPQRRSAAVSQKLRNGSAFAAPEAA